MISPDIHTTKRQNGALQPFPSGPVWSPLRNMSLTCEENRWKAAVPNLGRHVESGKKGATPCSNTEHLLGKTRWGCLDPWCHGPSQGPYIFRGGVFMVNHLGWKKVPAMSLPRVCYKEGTIFEHLGSRDVFQTWWVHASIKPMNQGLPCMQCPLRSCSW